MARGKGFLRNLFKAKEEDDFYFEYDIDDLEDDSKEKWDWDTLVKDRHLLKLSDEVERERFIKNLVEQVRNASDQLDALSQEYNDVTAILKDADELDALPESEFATVKDVADRVIRLNQESNRAQKAPRLMSEEKFLLLSQYADSLPKVYKQIKEAEKQRKLIKDDLKRLDDEKLGFKMRNSELKASISNSRGMLIICMFAAVISVIMLLVLQFGFDMKTGVGYVIVVIAVAVSVTIIYVRYLDVVKEQEKAYQSINRIILLQNTVKIRYVNNKNLIDYLYLKYGVSSAKELKKMIEVYEAECKRRSINEQNEKQLSVLMKEYKRVLQKYRLNDVDIWLANPLSVIDKKERVEIRHTYIINRQKLRAQMEYNKRMAKEGEKELRQLIEEYPRYANEVITMLERYS